MDEKQQGQAWQGSEKDFMELKALNLKASLVKPSSSIRRRSFAEVDEEYDSTKSWPLMWISHALFASEVSKSILDVIMSQANSLELRVQFAVEWDDEKRLQRELSSMPTWDQKRSTVLKDALQLALTLERLKAVRVCMDNAAPIKNIDLLALYDKLFQPGTKFNMFLGKEIPTVRRGRMLGDETVATPSSPGLSHRQGTLKKTRTTALQQLSQRTPVNRKQSMTSPSGGFVSLDDKPDVELQIQDAIYDFYPVEVWAVLQETVPGLTLYWHAKLTKFFAVLASDDAAQAPKLGARWLDVFVWAVLLGNTELATLLMPGCQEPIRAAIIGARICNYMADKLPLHQVDLRGAAVEHESFAVMLLTLCDSFEDARRMLITKSRHWNRTVLQLGVQSGLRDFCAHMHCQLLCDDYFAGNLDTEGPSLVLCNETSGLLQSVQIIAQAAVPFELFGRSLTMWTAPLGIEKPDYAPPRSLYYQIPAVKQLLRMTMHMCFIAIISYAAVEASLHPEGKLPPNWEHMDGHEGGGFEAPTTDLIVFVWNTALFFDEWYKYALDKKSFSADFWNKYDYLVILLTYASLGARLRSIELAIDVLSFNVVLVWCRMFKYLSINMEIGLLVIMVINMMTDIYLWSLVSMVFLGAFTIAFISIADTTKFDAGKDHPMTVPLWATLGTFDVHEVTEWNPSVGQAMLWLYVLVSNVILVNLLIAMMGHTFGVIKERADEEWKYGRLASVLEATERMSPVPPPFNLPITLTHFFRHYILGHELTEQNSHGPDQREAMSIAKKAKQKVARKLLLKYKRHLEDQAAEESQPAHGGDENLVEKIDLLVREVSELKRGTHTRGANTWRRSAGLAGAMSTRPPSSQEV